MTRPILNVIKKEAKEMLRDKRVVHAAFVAPVFMIVLFILLFGWLTTKVGDRTEVKLAILQQAPNQLGDILISSQDVDVSLVESIDEGLALLKDKKVGAFVEFSPEFSQSFVAGEAKTITHYDSSETMSSISLAFVRKTTEELNKQSSRAALVSAGLPASLAEPIKFEAVDEKQGEGLGGSLIIGLIPYLIVLWAFYGGFSAVSDMIAGEKERGTMETLLVSPITRRQAALGKFFALTVLCMTSSLTTLLGVMVVGTLNLPLTQKLFPTGLQVSLLSSIELVAILVPLVLFFAGVLVSVSAYAKNVREAQTLLTLVSFLVIMPAVFSQFIGLTGAQNAPWVAWTPILNAAVSLKDALTGTLEVRLLFATIATSLFLACVSLSATIWLFKREQILTRI